jgi:hypothetical protein
LLERRDFAAAREVIERCIEFERKVLKQQPGAGPVISMSMPDLSLATQDYARAEELLREKVNARSHLHTEAVEADHGL